MQLSFQGRRFLQLSFHKRRFFQGRPARPRSGTSGAHGTYSCKTTRTTPNLDQTQSSCLFQLHCHSEHPAFGAFWRENTGLPGIMNLTEGMKECRQYAALRDPTNLKHFLTQRTCYLRQSIAAKVACLKHSKLLHCTAQQRKLCSRCGMHRPIE